MTKNAENKIDRILEEAVHNNHPELNKRKVGNNSIQYNRNQLSSKIRSHRKERDMSRKAGSDNYANISDNMARVISKHPDVFEKNTPMEKYKKIRDAIKSPTDKSYNVIPKRRAVKTSENLRKRPRMTESAKN